MSPRVFRFPTRPTRPTNPPYPSPTRPQPAPSLREPGAAMIVDRYPCYTDSNDPR